VPTTKQYVLPLVRAGVTPDTVMVGLVFPDEVRVPGRSLLAPVIVVQLVPLYEVLTLGAAATALTALPMPITTLPGASAAPALNDTISADWPDVFIFVSNTDKLVIVVAKT
jgi:hypothetical protein